MPYSTLLLALGNDIMRDDAAALVAADILKERFSGRVDFVSTIKVGLTLMDIMSGYDRVLLLDTIITGEHEPGTIMEFSEADFKTILELSPHFMSLPDVIELAKRLSIDFPKEIRILALEIEQPLEFGETLSPAIAQAIPEYVQKAEHLLGRWLSDKP